MKYACGLAIHYQRTGELLDQHLPVGVAAQIGNLVRAGTVERCDLTDFDVRRTAQLPAESLDELAEAVSTGRRVHALRDPITVLSAPRRVA